MVAEPSLPEEPSRRKAVYLVTVAHPQASHSTTGAQLRSPDTFTRDDLQRYLLDAFANPAYADSGNQAGSAGTSVLVLSMVVFQEYHKEAADGEAHRHYHVAVRATHSHLFAPRKRALLARHGVASHWSSSHDTYSSALRYCGMPSPRKPLAALDAFPLLWSADGEHEPMVDAMQEPTTAAALEERRHKATLQAAEEGTGEPRVSEIDVWPIVVRHGIRNTDDNQEAHLRLIAVARETCSPAMMSFLFRIRRRLPSLIDDVWTWEEVHDKVALSQRSRMQCLLDAMSSRCSCGGEWLRFVEEALCCNGIDTSALAHDIHENLLHGRCETVPVIVLAGLHGGEGKSLLLQPLATVLGEDYVQEGLATGQFPLLGLESKRAIVLNEWRFDASVLPLSVQLLWFEGKAVPITRPQGTDAYYGHYRYKGSAPIFVTTPLKALQPVLDEAEAAIAEGQASDLTMLTRRLHVYKFTMRMPRPRRQLPRCAACFANFVLQGEEAWSHRAM